MADLHDSFVVLPELGAPRNPHRRAHNVSGRVARNHPRLVVDCLFHRSSQVASSAGAEVEAATERQDGDGGLPNIGRHTIQRHRAGRSSRYVGDQAGTNRQGKAHLDEQKGSNRVERKGLQQEAPSDVIMVPNSGGHMLGIHHGKGPHHHVRL